MKMYYPILQKTSLFQGFDQRETEDLLQRLKTGEAVYQRGQFIYREGDFPVKTGLLLEGGAYIIKEDFWGNRSILAEIGPAELFAETYNCLGREPLGVSVEAAGTDGCRCLFLDLRSLLQMEGTRQRWEKQALANLMEILAEKNLFLTKKMEHVTQRTTRQKLLSYLSEQSRRLAKAEFFIPFNRQQLADFLAVDRSAMSAELSRLKKEGILDYKKNWFSLKKLPSVYKGTIHES